MLSTWRGALVACVSHCVRSRCRHAQVPCHFAAQVELKILFPFTHGRSWLNQTWVIGISRSRCTQ
eukprot:144205-Pyramimonas_sp.AAC.1